MKNTISWKIARWLMLIVLPFNLVALFSAVYSFRHAESQTQNSLQNLANLSMTQLDTRISASDTFFFNLEDDRNDFKIYVQQGERDTDIIIAETELAMYFDRCTSNNTFVDCIYWNSDAYHRFYASLQELESYDRTAAAKIKSEMQELFAIQGKDVCGKWEYIKFGDSEWILRSYKKNGLAYGGLFSLDEIRRTLWKNSTFDDLKVEFFPKDAEIEPNQGSFSVLIESQEADLKARLSVPRASVLSKLSVMELISTIMMIVFLLVVPLLFLILNKIVVLPLHDIENAMKRIKNGDADYRLPEKKQADEFVLIDRTFNEMNDTMKNLKIQNYEREIEKKQMELKNLQLQIRPHFLMNMFNLLFSFAQIENYQSIQKLALYLSDYFRHIFQSNTETQPFEKEFMLIQKYLEISELRYPGWYEVIFNVDEDALEVEVPPLLIHNFVENIFKHVIDYEKITHIRLEAYTTQNEAIFMIVDDGCGMPQDMVEDINNGIFPEKSEKHIHVGIANSYRRLKSIYGNKARLLVDSIENKGTCFTVIIPMEEKDEHTDC